MIFIFVMSILLIGCGRTHVMNDLGIQYFELPKADPAVHSIVLGRFPEERYGPSNLPTYSSWVIRKKNSDMKVALVAGDKKVFGGSNFVYAFDTWSDIHYYALIIPSGTYIFEFSFPVGQEFLKLKKVYEREVVVKPGELLYMGSSNPVIQTNTQYSANKQTFISTYRDMEIYSQYEKDIGSFKKKYPSIFSDGRFVVKDLSKEK